MSNRVWLVLIIMLFATALAGCGDDADGNTANGDNAAKDPSGPAPIADGSSANQIAPATAVRITSSLWKTMDSPKLPTTWH